MIDRGIDQVNYPLPSNLIHDLRTPLNQVIGYSELLIEQVQENRGGELEPDLQKIRSAGLKLLALIDQGFEAIRTPDLIPVRPDLAAVEVPVACETRSECAPDAAAEPSEAIQLRLKEQPPELQKATAGDPGTKADGHVLVVDDVQANRDVLLRRLDHEGYAVGTAENGQAALDMLKAETFDLVLLDIMLPEIDGYEVLKRLKADEKLQHIPVIMISALGDMKSVARCIEMGAEDYLPKPFNPILLKARIGACLEKKRARDREMLLFEQLQQNYKRLQELEKLRDDLTYLIVHDLRTPLTSLIAGMQTLEALGNLDEDRLEMVEIAVTGGETLLSMINDLLDVNKMESGSMQLGYAPVDAARLVAAATRQVESLAQGKKLTVVTQVATGLPPFQGDEGILRRILVNLMGNAVKFTPSEGKMTVDARLDDSRRSMVFSVADTGEGIPAEAFEHIFEKFGQVESRNGGRNMGTGLGLTFCKLAIEAHGGLIGIESELGEGSKITFNIPLKRP